jgi:hypothetical protein
MEAKPIAQNKKTKFERELRERTVGYIVAAFGLVAGLAWNEAIKSLIEYWFPLAQKSLLAKVIYAFILTAVLVLVTVYLRKLLIKEEE